MVDFLHEIYKIKLVSFEKNSTIHPSHLSESFEMRNEFH